MNSNILFEYEFEKKKQKMSMLCSARVVQFKGLYCNGRYSMLIAFGLHVVTPNMGYLNLFVIFCRET